MKIFLGIFIVYLSLSANLKEEIEHCTKFHKDQARLKCYDRVAKRENNTPKKKNIAMTPKEDKSFKGKWEITSHANEIDDSKTVSLILRASEPIESQFGKDIYPDLILRCQSNKTSVYISWGRFITIDESFVVTRVDNLKARSGYWGMSTSNESTFTPKAISFIKKMFKHKKLIARTTPYGSNPVRTLFDIDGLENAIKPLRKTCHW